MAFLSVGCSADFSNTATIGNGSMTAQNQPSIMTSEQSVQYQTAILTSSDTGTEKYVPLKSKAKKRSLSMLQE